MTGASLPSAKAAANHEGADALASFAGVAADWEVLESSAGLVDATWRRFFPATGEERREFLHGQTTAHVKSLVAGSGSAALVLTAQGRPLGSFSLYEDGERLWIATSAAQAAATRAALSRFLVADDCDFEDEVGARCFQLVGPDAAGVLVAVGAGDAVTPRAWSVAPATIGGQAVMVFAHGELLVPAFDVLACDAEGVASDAAAVEAALLGAGAVRCGVDALEILRVESGTARFGVDVDEHRIAMEARLEWAIHFAKGCYVGQEVIERAVSRGRINHELCLLRLDGPVARGARIEGGSEADVVTSTVRSPRLGHLALAYLPRSKSEDGTEVTIDGVAAEVLPWPRPRILTGRDRP